MTKDEKMIVSAYTGVLMVEMSDFHKWVEEFLGHHVWTHEFATQDFWDRLKEQVKGEFLKLCEDSELSSKQWWYFTFGCGQKHAGHYVRIYGTEADARSEMFRRYGKEWAFQYSEDAWLDMECRRGQLPYPLETELKEK